MSRRNQRGRYPAPPPPPEGHVWDVDEWVPADRYAAESVQEMRAFDSLTPAERRNLDRTGQSALAYLEHRKREQKRTFTRIFLDW